MYKYVKVLKTALLIVIFSVLCAGVSFAKSNLEVHFIDVGQADAILIKCNDANMIIDGGNASDSQLIYSYLKKQNVTRLDYIVNTHGDEDHVGGLPGAIQLVGSNIGKVLAPYETLEKDRFNVFVNQLESFGKSITVPSEGTVYKLGEAEFQILSAGGQKNNESMIIRLRCGDTSFLFMGDATDEQEQFLADMKYDIESDILKVSHHGSNSSTGYRFLRTVYPKVAVITCGKNNGYGHPAEEVLSRLRDEGAQVFRTDNNGTIVFISDGTGIKYKVDREVSQAENLISGEAKSAKGLTSEESEQLITKDSDTNSGLQDYILNTNTKKFHYPGCKSVKQMKDKNKKPVNDSRENIIAGGYEPCKNCNP